MPQPGGRRAPSQSLAPKTDPILDSSLDSSMDSSMAAFGIPDGLVLAIVADSPGLRSSVKANHSRAPNLRAQVQEPRSRLKSSCGGLILEANARLRECRFA